MADNINVSQGTGTVLRTTDTAGVHTPHHLEDATQRAALLATQATIGTRAYGTGSRVAIGATSAQSAAITATEVLVHAKGGSGYIVAGSNPTATAATGIPVEDGEKFHLRITSGHKIAVIGDSAAGFLHIVPVA